MPVAAIKSQAVQKPLFLVKSTFMKYLFTLIIPVFSICTLSAQQRCGTHEKFLENAQLYPGYADAVNHTFEQAKQLATSGQWDKSGPVYRIPVVVHILYINPGQNIDDSLVYNQIQVLNEDFRRANPDTVNTRNEFKPIAADAGIEFYLATTDPQGNPTTGITRTLGTPMLGTYNLFTEDMKKSANGGQDAWPTDRYLNIWVCDVFFGAGVLGYAYPPIGNIPNWPQGSVPVDASLQGVVIQYSVFGKNNPNATGPLITANGGRTCTHEVGHFLGLRHIWGDGDCSEDDGISDTPDADDHANQICDWNKNTCTENPGPELPDNIENYMDYAADSCMNMFTQGQVDMMRSILENFRPDLYTEVTSVDQPVLPGFIQVYPNPSSGLVNIVSLSQDVVPGNMVALTSMLGERIILPYQENAVLDLSSLPPGIYMLEIPTNKGTVVKKVVLQ